jgi:hypothetical protein
MFANLPMSFNRVHPLMAGVFGHIDDADGKRTVRIGGSGFFVTPSLFITARHVSRDLFRTDPGRFDDLDRRSERYFHLPHSVSLFQPAAAGTPSSVIWSITRSWDSPLTDICMMEAQPDHTASSEENPRPLSGFLGWALNPPAVGEQVILCGFPEAKAQIGPGLGFKGAGVAQPATVTEVFPERRDRGMFSFPGFSVDKEVEGGFSGGPVIWRDQLCGVVSGASFGTSYIASLWPLLLTAFERPDQGQQVETLSDLFKIGELVSDDWPAIERQIAWYIDESGRHVAKFRPPA